MPLGKEQAMRISRFRPFFRYGFHRIIFHHGKFSAFARDTHESAERQPVHAVFRVPFLLCPDAWRETDAEFIHFKPEELCAHKMSRFMAKDQKRKTNENKKKYDHKKFLFAELS